MLVDALLCGDLAETNEIIANASFEASINQSNFISEDFLYAMSIRFYRDFHNDLGQ